MWTHSEPAYIGIAVISSHLLKLGEGNGLVAISFKDNINDKVAELLEGIDSFRDCLTDFQIHLILPHPSFATYSPASKARIAHIRVKIDQEFDLVLNLMNPGDSIPKKPGYYIWFRRFEIGIVEGPIIMKMNSEIFLDERNCINPQMAPYVVSDSHEVSRFVRSPQYTRIGRRQCKVHRVWYGSISLM